MRRVGVTRKKNCMVEQVILIFLMYTIIKQTDKQTERYPIALEEVLTTLRLFDLFVEIKTSQKLSKYYAFTVKYSFN